MTKATLSVDVYPFDAAVKAAEESLLGSLMAYPQLLPEVQDRLTGEHFYAPPARQLYALMVERARRGTLPDDIELPLAAARHSIDIGWVYGCLEGTTSREPAYLVVQILREYRIRHATYAALDMVRDLQERPDEVEAILSGHAETLLADTSSAEDGLPEVLADESLSAFVDASEGHGIAYSTGLDTLDSWLGGLMPSKLYVIAARPGMGKTALAMQIVARGDAFWGVVSLEMSGRELAGRLICRDASVDLKLYTAGALNELQTARLPRARDAVAALPFVVDDRAGLTWDQIAAKARKWSLCQGLQGLIVDYAQLIRKRDGRMSNNDHVAEVSGGCKTLAKSLDIPVVLLSQLNRQCEQRQDKRPVCSDLRDSGSIEQDADVVAMLYREDAYRAPHEANDGIAEVIIRKNRAGPTGSARLAWTGFCARFDDLS